MQLIVKASIEDLYPCFSSDVLDQTFVDQGESFTQRDELFPIPQKAIDENPALVQNPAY